MDDFKQALALHQQGQFAEAEHLYQRVLQGNPKHADTLHLLGLVEIHLKNYVEAERLLCAAIEVRPEIPDYRANYGLMLTELGRYDEAVQVLHHAIGLSSGDASLHFLLANALYAQGQYIEAESAYQQAHTLALQNAQILLGLANALVAQQRLEEAKQTIARALALNPQYAEALGNMGSVLQQMWQLEEAETYLRKALALNPRNVEALNNLGALLLDMGRPAEAEASIRAALEIHPAYAIAHNNLGNVMLLTRRISDAANCFSKAITLAPDTVNAHWNLGLAQLMLGDFENGWREYEWRTKRADAHHLYPQYPQPLWQGEELAGKRILLYTEQGLGDTLQFVRFAPLLAEMGAQVILQCQAPLKNLLSGMQGVASVLVMGEVLPAFDVYCPLLSLPYWIGINAEHKMVVQMPYIAVDAALQERWNGKVSKTDKLKIGLVWSGAPRPDDTSSNLVDKRRSMSLALFEPLWALQGVTFYSLQKGEKALEAANYPDHVIDLMGAVQDFTDTAALITHLDMVISVDTSVAHLAGALSKPTWLLSRFDGCWRWMLDREDTPWYPKMRLFRQQQAGSWDAVVNQVTQALQDLLAERGE